MENKTLTPQQVAEMLQVSYEHALHFIKYSGVKYFKVGRQYRVFERTLMRFLNEKTSAF